MEANSADIHAKYQKLATEYSKVRAQVSVLKKAVIDEQTKAVELKDVLKERDQIVRKYEQETDSLSFRNQQLSKRVTVLQDELESMQLKPKKNKHKSSDPGPSVSITNNVIGEELQSKIEENARLHKQVFDADQEHRQALQELSSRLDSVQQEASHYQQILETIQDQNKTVVEKLQQHKAQLEVRLQAQENELKVARLKAEECEEKLGVIRGELGGQLDAANTALREHLPFNDTGRSSINALNLPTHDRKHQARLRELIGLVTVLVRDFVTGLSNFHTYTEHRVLAYPEDAAADRPLKNVNKKFADFLHENASYLRPVEQAFLAFQGNLQEDSFLMLETAIGLQEFSDKFGRYVAYLNKLLPYSLLSIEDECSLPSCTPSLEAKNMQFHASIAKLTAVFNKLNSYISILAAQSHQIHCHPRSSQERLLYLLCDALKDLQEVIKEASVHYNSKVSLEHQLPTATQKLKTTDECVLSSMISLVTSSTKLSTVMSEKLAIILKDAGYWSRGSACSMDGCYRNLKASPAVRQFRRRASSYINDLQEQDCPDSVPYQEALKNREILLSSTESRESLARQLATSQEKINKLEQAKEHWMLEFQLLQIKHEKETKKLQKLEDQLRGSGDAVSTISSGSSTDELMPPVCSTDHGLGSPGTISMFGKLEIQGPHLLQGESREAEIKSYFTHHIKDLLTQMQVADSKAVVYQSELTCLQKRLQLAEQNRTKLQEQLAVSEENVERLKEELATTTQGYENQFTMMTEHLANMNDKLTAQKDEIDALKYSMSNSGSKKGRGK